MYVSPEYRNQSVGKALVGFVLRHLRNNPKIHKVRLSVNAPQESAIRLFQRAGFTIVGTAKDEIRVGDTYYDQIMMEQIIEHSEKPA